LSVKSLLNTLGSQCFQFSGLINDLEKTFGIFVENQVSLNLFYLYD